MLHQGACTKFIFNIYTAKPYNKGRGDFRSTCHFTKVELRDFEGLQVGKLNERQKNTLHKLIHLTKMISVFCMGNWNEGELNGARKREESQV